MNVQDCWQEAKTLTSVNSSLGNTTQYVVQDFGFLVMEDLLILKFQDYVLEQTKVHVLTTLIFAVAEEEYCLNYHNFCLHMPHGHIGGSKNMLYKTAENNILWGNQALTVLSQATIFAQCDFLIFSWLFRRDFLIFSWIIRTRKMHF